MELIIIKGQLSLIIMEIFHDYAFVVSGKKRKEVVKVMAEPRTPTELSKLLNVHCNVITRILKDLSARELVESYQISGKKKTYILSKRGELARQVLNSLIEPKTFPELLKHLRAHNNIAISIIKHMIHNGFVTIFKTINPTRKIYRLTQKGEAIREKLE